MPQLLHPYMRLTTDDIESAKESMAPAWPTFHRHHGAHRTSDSVAQPDDVNPGLEDAVRQLFHMTLASLRGYREIAHLGTDPELRTCVEILVLQRGSQCRALAQMSHSLYRQLEHQGPEDELGADPGAADIQLVWLRTIWSFEQDEFGRFGDNIEQAEAMLEDAFLNAANAFRNTGIATVFRQFAMNICGARQRWEELCDNLIRQ